MTVTSEEGVKKLLRNWLHQIDPWARLWGIFLTDARRSNSLWAVPFIPGLVGLDWMRKKAEQARGSSRPVINVPWCYLLQVLLSNSSRFAPVMDGTKPTNPVLSKVVLAGVLSQRQKVSPNIFILHSFVAPDQLAWKGEDTSVCHTLTALPISEEPTLGTSNRC